MEKLKHRVLQVAENCLVVAVVAKMGLAGEIERRDCAALIGVLVQDSLNPATHRQLVEQIKNQQR